MSAVLRAQLVAVRAQIDAILLGLDEASAPPPAIMGTCPHCGAPEEKQIDASTLSTPNSKLCLICREEYVG